ncbi:hemin uptake protein HemP [Piscinibacter terrae]|uniref:Hemin uptake protein HemP n=1 Tax=Piscinibacter terrae TaxID=2496871 RepID=A0A3N7HJH8_9BURK|nr:hemin uptake protein HemP [Albitalea terrae]RQP22217.1 hemin uptake protein HemP [Albitalea terrae]
MNDTERQTPSPPTETPAAQRQEQVLCSEQLFRGAQEVLIEHHGAIYRLRQTSLGKLILTK